MEDLDLDVSIQLDSNAVCVVHVPRNNRKEPRGG